MIKKKIKRKKTLSQIESWEKWGLTGGRLKKKRGKGPSEGHLVGERKRIVRLNALNQTGGRNEG